MALPYGAKEVGIWYLNVDSLKNLADDIHGEWTVDSFNGTIENLLNKPLSKSEPIIKRFRGYGANKDSLGFGDLEGYECYRPLGLGPVRFVHPDV